MGELHTLQFNAEVVKTYGAHVFISVDQTNTPNDPQSWSSLGGSSWTTPTAEQEYEVEFTPTKDYLRLYISSWTTPSGSNHTELYFDDILISDGTTEAVVGGGLANKVSYKYRIQDVTIGRFLSVDPLAHQFPAWSPYASFKDNPIYYIDPDGRAPVAGDQSGPGCCGGLGYVMTGLGQDLESAYNKFEYEAGKAYDATSNFVTDMFKTETPPTGSDIMSTSPNNTVKKIGNAVDVMDKAKDAGQVIVKFNETDFNNPEQTGDFIETAVQKTIEQIPVVGDAAEIIMEDAKQSDGLMNLDNKRMSNSYKGSSNQRNAWLQQFGANNRSSSDQEDKK